MTNQCEAHLNLQCSRWAALGESRLDPPYVPRHPMIVLAFSIWTVAPVGGIVRPHTSQGLALRSRQEIQVFRRDRRVTGGTDVASVCNFDSDGQDARTTFRGFVEGK
jgi:hypothetical protein